MTLMLNMDYKKEICSQFMAKIDHLPKIQFYMSHAERVFCMYLLRSAIYIRDEDYFLNSNGH